MFSLVLAGETVFLPAFHLGRYFKSSLLSVYGLDEFQLGQLGAIYGALATLCYFIGGPLADRWPARKLLAASLTATACGSLYMASIPSFTGLCVLFGFWGITTILAFWAPLIRATRDWAGADGQGRAFGILDAGRGLASAVLASLATLAFSLMLGGSAVESPEIEAWAVQRLVLSYGAYCLIAAGCVWIFVPESGRRAAALQADSSHEGPLDLSSNEQMGSLPGRIVSVLSSPAIWLQAIVIVAAYSAFKMLDNFGLYAEDAYDFTPVQAASLVANLSYLRVGAALVAGWVADRLLGVRTTIQLCFGLLLLAFGSFIAVQPGAELAWLMITNMAVSCIGFFALRGIYFALLEESGTPKELTGTAVGIISFVGYTPEIFMGPLTGWLIREARAEGDVLAGYRQIFIVLSLLCVLGTISAFMLRWLKRPGPSA